jgi:hypothetical protein
MENPGLRTLISFLKQVRKESPVNFSGLARGRRRGYGMVNRYIRYCMGKDLIRIVSERMTRGRYPFKTYALSEKGSRLLAIFDEEEKEDAVIRGSRHN